jgi:CHAT domain-containing protein
MFLKFAELYNSGDLFNAEKCMQLVLESKNSISEESIVAAYNNLGATNTLLGNYKKALEYYNIAEAQISEKRPIQQSLADIYINKALIYTSQNSFSQAIEYLEKGIRIYLGINYPGNDLYQRISTAYLNIGFAFYESKNYQAALEYLEKSAELKLRYNLPRIALVYFNIARTYVKTNHYQQAEEFYLKSMDSFNREYGENYYRTAELLFHYGLLLESEGRNSEARNLFTRALTLCLKTGGDKNIFVSSSYKHLGDYFLNRNNYDSSLVFYQKALIAIVNDFNDHDIHSNPSLDFSFNDIELLTIIKSKSKAFEQLAMQQTINEAKLVNLKKSLDNIEIAMQLIKKIRNDYMNEESRIYLADNEKETFFSAIKISLQLYGLTGDQSYVQKMYNITKQAKTAVLRSEITDNELFYSISISDTLQKEHKNILLEIGAYSNLILEEERKVIPDKKKLDFWSDKLFEMKRTNEKVEDSINRQFPQYRELLQKTEPMSIEQIQANLNKDETLIEYFLSNQYIDGRRKLYIFLVSRDKLYFHETLVDSLFKRDVELIRQGTVQIQSRSDPLDNFRDYTRALFNMYVNLIKPVEDHFCGNKLIIVPDEEIAFLPFDAFLKSCPDSTQINYEELQYLIYHYTFSYGYSSSLIFNDRKAMKKEMKVYAFAPDYLNKSDNSGKSTDYLAGAKKEIGSIFKWFPGKEYLGDEATETNFNNVIVHPAVIHLAMHSQTDPENSKYSCLLFNPGNDSLENGKLFNYEICLSRIKSPMVVLSSCNTGSGTLSQGEGINSLARGFILAGALSVVITSWDINDESSADIISRFYYHLSKGTKKADAMRLAKLEYLKSQQPVYTNPYYWAAYEVLGENSPIVPNDHSAVLLICSILLFAGGGFLIYLKWRKIFSARS